MNQQSSPLFEDAPEVEARGAWVRLHTLIALRWLALAGQTAAVLAARFVFGLDPPLIACAVVVAIPAVANVVAAQVHPPAKRLTERDAMLWLLFDLAQLGLMLGLTGGLTNPFAVLLLAPVTIAASVLSVRSTLTLASTAMATATILLIAHRPLVGEAGPEIRPPELYLLGVWAAVSVGIVFTAIYTRRIALETARMSEALGAAQSALSREQRLTAIGALAAAAAHELGTPLATIKLVSKELARDLADNEDAAEDLKLLAEQADRCREILRDLSDGGRDDKVMRTTPLSALLREAAGPHVTRGKEVVFLINGEPASAAGDAQPMVTRRPEIIQGLRNLVQNAVDFAATTIWMEARVGPATLRIAVTDDGPGFKPEVLAQIGDPYVTTRGRGRRQEREGGYQGMGLGLFIAKTLLERTGARVVFTNGSGRAGAVCAAIWPNEALIADREATRGAMGRNPRFDA